MPKTFQLGMSTPHLYGAKVNMPIHQQFCTEPFLFSFFNKLPYEDIKSTYDKIELAVDTGRKNANAENKKLLLLAGENHISEISQILEIMLLFIAKDIGMNHLLIELHSLVAGLLYATLSDEKLAKEKNNPFGKDTIDYFPTLSSSSLAYRLKMQIHGMDSFISLFPKLLSNFYFYKITWRDRCMVNNILKVNKDAVMIAGAAHLRGIMTNPLLRDKYYVVGFNFTNMKSELNEEECMHFAVNPTKVEQVSLCGNSFTLFKKSIPEVIRFCEEKTAAKNNLKTSSP